MYMCGGHAPCTPPPSLTLAEQPCILVVDAGNTLGFLRARADAGLVAKAVNARQSYLPLADTKESPRKSNGSWVGVERGDMR